MEQQTLEAHVLIATNTLNGKNAAYLTSATPLASYDTNSSFGKV